MNYLKAVTLSVSILFKRVLSREGYQVRLKT